MMTRRSDVAAIRQHRYSVDGLAARESIDAILRLSSQHVACWFAIRYGIITAKKTGAVSVPMMSRILMLPLAQCQGLLKDMREVVYNYYGTP